MKIPPFDSLDIVKKEDKDDKKTADKTAKTHPKYTFKMLPIYVGATMTAPMWTQSSIVGFDANQYGLKTEVVATDKVRFFAEMTYLKSSEAKSTDLSALPNEVPVPTTEPNLAFKYWEIYGLKSFNYTAGIQYRFGKNEIIRPYVAAAFNGTTTLPFNVEFDYEDKNSSMEKGFKRQVTNKITHLNRFYTAIGVHWQPFSRGQLSAETYLTIPFTSDKALTPTQVGIKIGAFYFIR